ncbi:MAG TPA: TagF domain-containing protein [Desulfomonilia bacterium]|nr:TagF domain-containing protein [Desulfomonilia bacterium]
MASWVWGVSGKHPVVKDYIRLGRQTLLMEVFSHWVEEGYHQLGDNPYANSWRFLAKGMRPDELACGILRDSSDRTGRPFPLLIMGCGVLKGWSRSWETLPRAFEVIWERLESLCAKRLYDLEELKGALIGLPSPVLPEQEIAQAASPGGPQLPRMEDGVLVVPLEGEGDHATKIVHLLGLMAEHTRSVPDAIFMGGPPERAFLAVFCRSLNAEDFMRLWTMEKIVVSG